MAKSAGDESAHRRADESVGLIAFIDDTLQERDACNRDSDDTGRVSKCRIHMLWMVNNLQQTKTEKYEKLDLLRRRHLQLEDDGNGKGKQDDLCNDLVDDCQFQDDEPVEALCCLCGFEVPLRFNRIASDSCCHDEGNCEASCEGHEGIDGPLQPYVRENAEVQAQDAVLEQQHLDTPKNGGDVGYTIFNTMRRLYAFGYVLHRPMS